MESGWHDRQAAPSHQHFPLPVLLATPDFIE
jgi:hypothetical protein